VSTTTSGSSISGQGTAPQRPDRMGFRLNLVRQRDVAMPGWLPTGLRPTSSAAARWCKYRLRDVEFPIQSFVRIAHSNGIVLRANHYRVSALFRHAVQYQRRCRQCVQNVERGLQPQMVAAVGRVCFLVLATHEQCIRVGACRQGEQREIILYPSRYPIVSMRHPYSRKILARWYAR
jgi:hypothetical protein